MWVNSYVKWQTSWIRTSKRYRCSTKRSTCWNSKCSERTKSSNSTAFRWRISNVADPQTAPTTDRAALHRAVDDLVRTVRLLRAPQLSIVIITPFWLVWRFFLSFCLVDWIIYAILVLLINSKMIVLI